MHLEKVQTVLFGAITDGTKSELSPLHSKDPMRTSLLGAVLIFLIVGLILKWTGVKDGLYSVILLLTLFVLIVGAWIFTANELYLPYNTRRWQWQNRAAIKQMRRRVQRFNGALVAQQTAQWLLPQAERDNDELLAAYWEQERRNLQADVDRLLKGFEEAVSKDFERLEKRLGPTRGHPEFRYKVKELERLEKSLAEWNTDPQHTDKPNAHGFLTAKYLRQQLEQERRDLGLPESALPPRRVKLL